MITLIKNIFEEVYGNYSGYKVYELNIRNERNKKCLNSFILLLQHKYNGGIDADFLLQFIVLQFRNYEHANTRLGKGKVYLNWIFGKKAIQRWENKSENWLYWNNQFIKKYNIKKISEVKYIIDQYRKNVVDNIERKRFFNTERGLIHCRELDLFKKYNKHCNICKFKIICNG